MQLSLVPARGPAIRRPRGRRNQGYPVRHAEGAWGSRRCGGGFGGLGCCRARPRDEGARCHRLLRHRRDGDGDAHGAAEPEVPHTDSQREDGWRRAPRERLAHAPHRGNRHGRAAAGRVHARRAAPDRGRPGRRARPAARLGSSHRGTRLHVEPIRRTLPGLRRCRGSPLRRDRHRLRAGRRHARRGGQLPRLTRLLALPHLECTHGPRLRRRPADERDRGDRQALPRPRPREREHRQGADRDPSRRLEAPRGPAAVPERGPGRRAARDGLDRGVSQARRLEEAGRLLEHDHQRAAAEAARLHRA